MNRIKSIARTTIERCQATHPDAFDALLHMAGTDGTVSRQELRIILGFCERNGTPIDPAWPEAEQYINSGLKISAQGTLHAAEEKIDSLKHKPIAYRASFLGAIEAIAASTPKPSANKRRILERARAII